MGHPFVKTPNLDAFMRDSVRFKNAYTATPVCSPSRVSFFTGMPERIHGVGFSTSYDLTEAQWEQTYPALFRKGGYHTGFIGKFGVEYYTFKGRASEKFDYWWAHDGWTKFLPKDHHSPSTTPYHRAKQDLITFVMGEAITVLPLSELQRAARIPSDLDAHQLPRVASDDSTSQRKPKTQRKSVLRPALPRHPHPTFSRRVH